MDGLSTLPAAGAGQPALSGNVVILSKKDELLKASLILEMYFVDHKEEIRELLTGNQQPSLVKGQKFFPIACFDHANVMQSACVCMEKKIPLHGLKAFEIVWFGSVEKGSGWGSKLLQGIFDLAKQKSVDAILTTSTNTALRFWLTRPNIRIAETILRASNRSKLEFPTKLGFQLSPLPTSSSMLCLYTENLLRNRKGKLIGDFEGKPYHYSIASSNHVWYILNPKLKIPTRMHAPVVSVPAVVSATFNCIPSEYVQLEESKEEQPDALFVVDISN